ncbi:hypothetical protein [Algivirga pacifica]|uniref:Uncharacterized protein n=1 Tax=Algivirga pacifica TaxID=1162670 RepID=A0ABP9D2A6_9BACT
MRKRILGVLCLLSFAFTVQAQKVLNLATDSVGGQIVVKYDLQPRLSEKEDYEVSLYYITEDDNTVEAKGVRGAVGKVSPGSGNLIYWKPEEDLDEYRGNIRVMVEAKQNYSPIMPLANKGMRTKFKKKKPKQLKLSWMGGGNLSKYKVYADLYKNGRLVKEGVAEANATDHQMMLSTPTDKGSKYQYRLRDEKGIIVAGTPEFKVKGSGAFGKVLLLGAAGAVAGVVLTSGGDDIDEPEPGPNALPDPPFDPTGF